jgi:hypothetical protein
MLRNPARTKHPRRDGIARITALDSKFNQKIFLKTPSYVWQFRLRRLSSATPCRDPQALIGKRRNNKRREGGPPLLSGPPCPAFFYFTRFSARPNIPC